MCSTCGCKGAESFCSECGTKRAESFEAESRKTGVICGYKGCKGNLLEKEYGGSLSKLHCDKCNYSEFMEWDAESFEAQKSPALKNLSTFAVLALAIFVGMKLKE